MRRAIVVPTFSGRTASAVARLRTTRPIAAIAGTLPLNRSGAVEWGVVPLASGGKDVDDLWTRREAGVARGRPRRDRSRHARERRGLDERDPRRRGLTGRCGRGGPVGPRRETLQGHAAAARPRSAARRRSRLSIAVVAGGCLRVFLYRPVKAYISTSHQLAQRTAEVRALAKEKSTLERLRFGHRPDSAPGSAPPRLRSAPASACTSCGASRMS